MSVNLAVILGRIGQDVKTREANGGMLLADFSVATSKKVKGEEQTVWHNVRAFGKTAEIARDYLRKGDQVHIEGSIDNGKYQDKQGNDKYYSQILVNRLTLIGGKRDGQQNQQQSTAGGSVDVEEDSIPF